MHRNEWIKIASLSVVRCSYFIHNEIYTVRYEVNDFENTSLVQSESRTIIRHSVNLSEYEIKELSPCFSQIVIMVLGTAKQLL